MTKHARLGPSKLHSAKLCPGSVNASARLPREANEYAAEGTLLHDILADCLEHDFEPEDFVGQERCVEGFEFNVDDNMISCLGDFIDWVRDQPGEVFIEKEVLLDPYMPGQFGTLDLGILLQTPKLTRLTIGDFKSGFRVVGIIGNYQVRAYAIGFIETYLRPLGIIPDEIVLFIEQPRAINAPRYYEPWTISYDELMEFAAEMTAIYNAAMDPNAPLIAGREQCLTCDVKDSAKGCDVYEQFMLDLLEMALEDLEEKPELTDVAVMTPERRSYLVIHAAMIKSWLGDLEKKTLADALMGDPTPNLKAIEGPSGHRKWDDEEKVAETLAEALEDDQIFTKKVISPSGAEKLLKPGRKKPGNPEVLEKLQALIVLPDLKPMLVLSSDPRPAIQVIDEDDFDDLP